MDKELNFNLTPEIVNVINIHFVQSKIVLSK